MKVGFTGTQEKLSVTQFDLLAMIISELTEMTEAHHGDCIGADITFHILVEDTRPDVAIHRHMPENTTKQAKYSTCNVLPYVDYEPKPYLERNHDIVDACDVLIACPRTLEEELRSGTWATVRYARNTGKPVAIIWKDGKYTYENKSDTKLGKAKKDENEAQEI